MLPEVQLNRSQVRLNRKEGAVTLPDQITP